ncbi:MAG: GTP 3',8-cyclase MoaA [Oscillospiraceae bacterium]
MRDRFGRNIHYLRVSVTDRCNLRCQYCMPAAGVCSIPHEEVLRFDEVERVARVMAELGVDRVRLTGGEPLVRKNVAALAASIKRIPGIGFLGLTTNGTLLQPLAHELRDAGVDGLNISLDTLDENRYFELTRGGALQKALDGLHAALAQGFPSVKVNCVLAPQSTRADWLGVVALARDLPVDVRLIEWMPVAGEAGAGGIENDVALELLAQAYGPLAPAEDGRQGGPAQYWKIAGFKGRLGIIHAMSHNFCAGCNRLRLTAAGNLKLCLFYDSGLALKPLLRGGATDAQLAEAIQAAVLDKPLRHHGQVLAGDGDETGAGHFPTRGMYKTGG